VDKVFTLAYCLRLKKQLQLAFASCRLLAGEVVRADKSLKPLKSVCIAIIAWCMANCAGLCPHFLLVRLLNVPEGTWPLITLVVVMGPISFWGNVVPRAFERIGGTILGSALGLVALKLELISLPVMVLWCAVAMFLCGWLALGKKPYQALLIGITLAVVVGAPPAICTPRCGEAATLSLAPCWRCCSPASGRSGRSCTGVSRWQITSPPSTASIRPGSPQSGGTTAAGKTSAKSA
jgi:hypothetical protein